MSDERDLERIDWKNIPNGSTAKMVRKMYVISTPDGIDFIAMWSGHDARKAQKYLDGLVEQSKKP